MIHVEKLSKFYGDHRAVDAVSFRIAAGEIVGILGLNGAGKSTILKMLGTFLLPSAGVATVAGYSVTENPDGVRRSIGYLPDSPPLYNEMRVAPYLAFVAKLKDVPSAQVGAAVDEAIRKTNLEEVAETRLSELSHGFRQRVGIASAIVHKPKVLILDEPINGLDPVQIVEMRDLIISLKKEHTVILSSHILSEITKTCDRILIVDKGKLVAEGLESELSAPGVAQGMRLTCEIDDLPNSLQLVIEQIPTVKRLEVHRVPGKHVRMIIDTTGDTRPVIARKVIESGAGMLSFTAEEVGLEGLFMKLVGSAKEGGTRG